MTPQRFVSARVLRRRRRGGPRPAGRPGPVRRRRARPGAARRDRPQRTQLYSSAQRTPSSVTAQGCRPMPPPALKHRSKYERSSSVPRCRWAAADGLADVPVRGEGAHDRVGVTGVQRGQVAADDVTRLRRPGRRGSAAGRGGVRRPAIGCSTCGTPPTGRPATRRRPPPATPVPRPPSLEVGQQLDHGPPVDAGGGHASRSGRGARPARTWLRWTNCRSCRGRGPHRRGGRGPPPRRARVSSACGSPLFSASKYCPTGIGLARRRASACAPAPRR